MSNNKQKQADGGTDSENDDLDVPVMVNSNEPKAKLTRPEKRVIIKKLLKNNLPVKNLLFFGTTVALVGLAGIALQIVLIWNQSPGSYWAGGIWGGIGAFLIGFLRLVLCNYILSCFQLIQ